MLLDPSPAMLARPGSDSRCCSGDARQRVTLLEADGQNAVDAVMGYAFDAVLCHGVLGYLERPEPMVGQLCRCAAPGGTVSIMTANARASAVRPALERRWATRWRPSMPGPRSGCWACRDGPTRSRSSSALLRAGAVEPEAWYGVWLFVDWLEFSGAELDLSDDEQLAAMAAVELEASSRDPYRHSSPLSSRRTQGTS